MGNTLYSTAEESEEEQTQQNQSDSTTTTTTMLSNSQNNSEQIIQGGEQEKNKKKKEYRIQLPKLLSSPVDRMMNPPPLIKHNNNNNNNNNAGEHQHQQDEENDEREEEEEGDEKEEVDEQQQQEDEDYEESEESIYARKHSILATTPQLHETLTTELCHSSENVQAWSLMFSSSLNGFSFPRLLSAFKKVKGGSILVIEEEIISASSSPSSSSSSSTSSCSATEPAAATSESENTNHATTATTHKKRRSVFGGVSLKQGWNDVKTREMNAKSQAAAKLRAQRTGVKQNDLSIKPSNQGPQFFGDNSCFVFRVNFSDEPKKVNKNKGKKTNKKEEEKQEEEKEGESNQNEEEEEQKEGKTEAEREEDEEEEEEEEDSNDPVSVFKPRNYLTSASSYPSSYLSTLQNSNFMYLFDQHPDHKLVGFGFGGSSDIRGCVGNSAGMAFFIDRTLARGEACVGGCSTTFGSGTKKLTARENTSASFKVKTIEFWAIDEETIERDYSYLSAFSVAANAAAKKKAAAKRAQMKREAEEGGKGEEDEQERFEEEQDYRQKPVLFSSPALTNVNNSTTKAILEMAGRTFVSEQNDRIDC